MLCDLQLIARTTMQQGTQPLVRLKQQKAGIHQET